MKIVLIFIIGMGCIANAFGQNPKDYVVNVSTIVSENDLSVTLNWEPVPERFKVYISRKNADSTEWGKAKLILPSGTTKYTDEDIESGVKYEYKIEALEGKRLFNYVQAGIKCKETEYRGKLILLVDSKFTEDLKYELSRLESDLAGDGWQVLRMDVSRDASVAGVKATIRKLYNNDTENVNTLFLFGHVPVPYSGNDAFDGHYDKHKGAWPADLYYGDMDEESWTDHTVKTNSAINEQNHNVPGDGKFDQNKIPVNHTISLAVGRVDFHNLPVFPQSETELLRSYLDKNHAYRHKEIEPEMQALVDNNFKVYNYFGVPEVFAISGWRNFTALLNSENVKEGKFFRDSKNESYIWSYACGGGSCDSCKYVGSAKSFVRESPRTVFTGLYGSWYGDWNTKNNFMRAALASRGWILTSCWAGRPHYTFHQMGMGETIGNCVKATQNNSYIYQPGLTFKGIHQSLMGDPSLRMHMVRPVKNLHTEVYSSNSVLLSWYETDDDIMGYYIYKQDALTNKYYRINRKMVTQTFFEDFSPHDGVNHYMVRTLKLSKVASGSYYNLSQGVFDTLFYEPLDQKSNVATRVKEVEVGIKIYPNPSTGKFTLDFGASTIEQAKFSIVDIYGRGVCIKQFENCTHAILDLSEQAKGVYILKGTIDNKVVLAKICLQ